MTLWHEWSRVCAEPIKRLHGNPPPTHLHTQTQPRQVVGVSLAIAVASYPLGRWIYFRHWRKMTQHEMFEQKMLRWAQDDSRQARCLQR